MAGDKGNGYPRMLMNSGDEAAAQPRTTLNELQPDLVITYDADGDHGHPDHVRAHDITITACRSRSPMLWTITNREAMVAGLDAIIMVPENWRACDVGDFAVVTGHFEMEPDDVVVAAKAEAMHAHAIQVWFADDFVGEVNPDAVYGQTDGSGRARVIWILSNLLCQPVTLTEAYRFGTAAAASLKALGELTSTQLLLEPAAGVGSVPNVDLAAEGSAGDE